MFCLIIKKELSLTTIKNNLNNFFFPTQVFEIVIEEAKNDTDIGFMLSSGGDYVFKTTLDVFPAFTDLTEQDLAIFLSKELDTQVVIDDGLNNGCGFLMVFPSGAIIPCTEEGGDTLDFYFSDNAIVRGFFV